MENMIKQNERMSENGVIPNNMIIDSNPGIELIEIPQKNFDNEIGRINKIYESKIYY